MTCRRESGLAHLLLQIVAGKQRVATCYALESVSDMSQFYYQVMGDIVGPLTLTELRRHASTGQLQPDFLVRHGSKGDWILAEGIYGLFDRNGTRIGPSEPSSTALPKQAMMAQPMPAVQSVEGTAQEQPLPRAASRPETTSTERRPSLSPNSILLIGAGLVLLLAAAVVGSGKESSVSVRRASARDFDSDMNKFTRRFNVAQIDTASEIAPPDHAITFFLGGAGILCLALGIATVGSKSN